MIPDVECQGEASASSMCKTGELAIREERGRDKSVSRHESI